MRLDVTEIIEAARSMAQKSRDLYAPAVAKELGLLLDECLKLPYFVDMLQRRMNLAMDCYLIGVAETIKRTMGDSSPESWADEYEYESRLRELIDKLEVVPQ